MINARCWILAAFALMILPARPAAASDGYSYEANAPVVRDYAVGAASGQPVAPDMSTWHAGYYHTMWGRPVALVVPPTATHQTNWGWGIGNTRVTPIYPQFMGPTTSAVTAMPYGPYLPTPYYVSDTLQIGVYYIRGPW